MKARNGRVNDKPRSNIGNWLKRYFSKNTCRDSIEQPDMSPKQRGYSDQEKGIHDNPYRWGTSDYNDYHNGQLKQSNGK